MVYTLTLNPSLDYVISVDNFETGKINRTAGEVIYPGGKGLNVSIVLNNLGYKSTALGFLAGYIGENIDNLISKEGINTSFIYVNDGLSRINIKLRSYSKSENNPEESQQYGICEETEINGKGPSIKPEDIKKLYEVLNHLTDGDILILAGSIPAGLPKTIYKDICDYLKDKNVKIVVDAEGQLLTEVLSYKPFLIKPNHHELSKIFEADIRTKNEAIIYAKKLQESGARNVIVSMAEKGAVMVTETGLALELDAPKGTVINSVGAGDSMVAGFIAGYLEKADYEYAFKYGLCTGSASAFSLGLATKEDVLKISLDFYCKNI